LKGIRFFGIALVVFALAAAASAQQPDRLRELEKQVQELQQRLDRLSSSSDEAIRAQVEELRRQIDVLTREIENLKSTAPEKAPEASGSRGSFGLGPAASKVYGVTRGVSIGGYGEAIYQNFDKRTDGGEPSGRTDSIDLARAVFYFGYKFDDHFLFNSEIEYEHANTERNGEIEVEFAYLDYLIRPEFNVRAGLMLMPVGITNEQHEPTAYFGARRPIVDSRIIPTTWEELGAGVFGDIGPITYRAYLTTSFTSENFTATGIRGGRQLGSQAKADDLAAVARVDWHPFEGATFGGSLFTGNTGQDRGYSGRVTLGEVHADAKVRGFTLRGLYASGTVDDAAAINAANNLRGNASVGESFGGWYVEGGYDVALRREMTLTPYARYEWLNTQRDVPAGFSRNPANEQRIFTVGFAFKPISQTVVKVDYQNVDNEAGTGINQWNIALGYIF